MSPLTRHPSASRAFLLVLLVFAVFSPLMLSGEFFWDDFILLVDNPLIKSTAGLRDIWFSARNPDYFPLTSTTFWIEWRLWGLHPQGYHLTNILLHAGSAIVLWRILCRLQIPGAFLIAALFAVHPVNVESVAWIAERKNTLSMFCLCLSVWYFLRADDTRRMTPYALAVLFFLLALLAKTAVVMAPFVLLAIVLYRRRRCTARDLLLVAPFFALSLLLGLVTIYFQYHVAISDVLVRDDPFPSRLAIAGRAVWFYISKIILPVHFSFNYPRWPIPARGFAAFLPLAALVILVTTFVAIPRRWSRSTALTLAAYVLMLTPMLGFLNIFFMRYSLVSDHWQYHATPICLTLIVAGLVLVARSLPARIPTAAATLAVLLFALDSASIAAIYRTPESIWLDTLAHNPASWLAHANLGELYLARANNKPQDLPRAIDHLHAVINLQPQLTTGYTNLGNAYVRAGSATDALVAYNQGLTVLVASADERCLLHYNLGALYAKIGNYPQAEFHILEAARLNPHRAGVCVPALLALANIEIRANHTDTARVLVEEILALDPGSAAARALRQSTTLPK